MTAVVTEEMVKRDLKNSCEAWNRGDIATMCGYYAPDARFLTSKGLIVGRDNILTYYKQAYPDALAMGFLKLELQDFIPRTSTATVRWRLVSSGGEHTGFCTLVYEPRGDELQVVYDNPR